MIAKIRHRSCVHKIKAVLPGGGGTPLYWVTGCAAEMGGFLARVFLELGINFSLKPIKLSNSHANGC